MFTRPAPNSSIGPLGGDSPIPKGDSTRSYERSLAHGQDSGMIQPKGAVVLGCVYGAGVAVGALVAGWAGVVQVGAPIRCRS